MEVLSPSGSLESLIAAINGGADACYLGLNLFSARKAAKNFDLEELKEALRIAHTLGVKIYVAVNTLIKEEEFSELINLLDEAYLLGVDSFIVQDYGLINLIAKRYKDVSLHISTQVNITNAKEALHFKKIGSDRVVLARELSYEEIKRIKEEAKIELEVFVHGAICVSYSGNCYFSKSIGPRSGNRGDCAQVCRKVFSLYQEDEKLDEAYLISPKDMSNIEDLARYQEAGIDSLKIEGRLKSSAYAYYVTKMVKDKITKQIAPDLITLKKLYNRDFTNGFINSELNIINKNTNNHLGVLIGKVVKVTPRYLSIKLKDTLNVSDGIRIKGQEDYGFTVTSMFKNKQLVNSASKGEVIDLINDHYKVKENALVFLTKDYKLEQVTTNVERKRLIRPKFTATNGFMSLEYEDIKVTSEEVSEAINRANTLDEIDAQLRKLGKTLYDFEITYEVADNLFINNKALTKLKLAFVEKLDEKFLKVERKIYALKEVEVNKAITRDVYVVCETLEQIETAKKYPVKLITRGLEGLAYPKFSDRINLEAKEEKDLMVSDYTYLETSAKWGSSYLNVYNTYSAKEFLKYLDTVFMSHELSVSELLSLDTRGLNVGVLVYGKIDVMIMKTCPIRNHYQTNLGCNLCKKKHYYLSDAYNNKYLMKEESNCNLRIIDYKAINLLASLASLKEKYPNQLIYFTTEDSKKVDEVLGEVFK